MDQLIADVKQFIANLVDSIYSLIRNMINSIEDLVRSFMNNVISFLRDIYNQIAGFIRGLVDSIKSAITSVVNSIVGVVRDFISTVVASIRGFIDKAANAVSDTFAQVKAVVTTIVAGIKDYLKEAFTAVTELIGDLIGRARDYFLDIASKIKQFALEVFASAASVINTIKAGIKDFIDNVINKIGATVRELLETISDLPGELRQLRDRLIESADKNIGKPVKELGADIAKALANVIANATKEDQGNFTKILDNLNNPSRFAFRTPEDVSAFVKEHRLVNPVLNAVAEIAVIPFIVWSLASGIANANSERVLQEYALHTPYKLVGVADLVDAYRRNLITESKFTLDVRKQGYADEDVRVLRQLGEQRLQLQEALTLWLRDLYTDGELKDSLRALGLSDSDIEKIKEAAFFIPPPGDLITMAVREVFSPDIAERFGQFQNFPPEFEKWAGKQGISPEWAKNYWAAHWALPSPNMGFEMFQRQIINEEDLHLLMRALDVMPFWRDKLIQLSYSPLTRVDIRRMHKLGVLTREQVVKAHRDIGYSPADAELLTKFTEDLNGVNDTDNPADLTGLARGGVVGLYVDGAIDRETAHRMLIDVGNSEEAADLYLIGADIDIQRLERKAAIELVKAQHKAGIISFEQANDKLVDMGLSSAEVLRAMNEIAQEQATRTKLPTLAQLSTMVKKKVIAEPEFIDVVQRLGYDKVWAQRLFTII